MDAMPDDPTPDEIQRACQQIQATWSDAERRRRARVLRPIDLDELHHRRLDSARRGKGRWRLGRPLAC